VSAKDKANPTYWFYWEGLLLELGLDTGYISGL